MQLVELQPMKPLGYLWLASAYNRVKQPAKSLEVSDQCFFRITSSIADGNFNEGMHPACLCGLLRNVVQYN